MDLLFRKVLALIIPWLIMQVFKLFSKASGGAALADVLEDLGGPLGMSGGIGVLIAVALITDAVVGRIFFLKFKKRVNKMKEANQSRDAIVKHISSRGLYSRSLRHRILMAYAMPQKAAEESHS
jgi:hypothetical protein